MVSISTIVNAQVMGGASAAFANQQLRAMFANINPPTPQPPIFYDQAVHFIAKSWWTPSQTDTSNTTTWSVLVDEMYTSHYDTTLFPRADSIFSWGNKWGADTVPIGLVYYRYCTLKDSAMYDTTYFHIDTTGPTLYDNPNAISSPYLNDSVFSVCSFKDNTNSGTLVFRIDPNLMFFDPALLISDADGRDLQLNFDDGTGWHTFSTSNLSFHNVVYDSAGIHTISARIVVSATQQIEAIAYSDMASPAAQTNLTQPDETWTNIPGIEIGVYHPCNYGKEGNPPKWIIVLEGFDFFEDTGVKSTFNKIVRSSGLENLRNYGYGFLVVNWKDSKKSMIDNAMHIVNLYDYLKCNYLQQINDDPQHQFVIIGESMGGVIARYALTYMEANPGFSSCFPDLHHNTRLYISLDAPHQGAYVPLAFQELYDDVTSIAPLPAYIVQERLNLGQIKNSAAATELMNLHSNTNAGGSTTYLPHPNRVAFLASLNNLNPNTGGYPEQVKMVAISNGLLTGERQLGLDDNCIITPGDSYLDADLDVYQTILGLPYKGQHYEISLRSIRHGQPFYVVESGELNWGIQLQWKTKKICAPPFNWPCIKYKIPWGVKVGLVSEDSVIVEHQANNTPSYDVMPGGRLSFDGSFGLDPIHWGTLWNLTIPWFSPPQSPTQCPEDTVVSIRVTGLFNSANTSITSQGLNFCFVPVQSALDYSGPVQQDHDIYTESTSTKMNRTPFDVIVGEINGLNGYPQQQTSSNLTGNSFGFGPDFPSQNLGHVSIRNHQLTDSTLQNMALQGILPSQLVNNENYLALYLNREIGDEAMWIENLFIDRPSLFQAEYDVVAGKHVNPYYDYANAPVQQQFIFKNYGSTHWNGGTNPHGYGTLPTNGIFSKENPFTVGQNGTALLRAQNSISTNGSNIIGILWIDFSPQIVCDSAYNKRGDKNNTTIDIKTNVSIFPNPVKRTQTLTIEGLEEGWVQIQVLDLNGRILIENSTELQEDSIAKINVGSKINSGLYVVRVLQRNLHRSFKITIL